MEHFPHQSPFLLLLFLISLPLFLFVLFHHKRNPSKSPEKPSKSSPSCAVLRAYPVIGHLPQFLRHRHRLLDWTTDLLLAAPTNTIVFRRPGNVRGIITANPAVVEHVLKTNFDNYPKGPRFTSILQDFLGRGIFNSDGEQWRSQRKTASFEFNTRSLRHFVVENVRREIATRLLPLLRKAAATGAVVDLQDVLERFAFDNVCKVSFDEDPACLAVGDGSEEDGGRKLSAGFALAFKDAANLSAERFRYAIPGMWKIKRFLNMGSEKRLREAASTVHDFATTIIRSRKKERERSFSSPAAATHDDLLSRFINGGGGDTDEFLRDIVISFLLAGRETTSSALSWFFWILSSRPHVERKILEELAAVRARRRRGDGTGVGGEEEEAFGFEELKEMNYLHAAVSEALRLYPPVAIDTMACREDDVLPDGTPVMAGWFMSYSAYAMGRMEAIWGEDCQEYRPERWLAEDGGGGVAFRSESPFRFPVFHAGPRMCLGKEMAYIQMKSIAAAVLERFAVDVMDPGKSPEKMLSLTLRMRGGLPVRVRAM